MQLPITQTDPARGTRTLDKSLEFFVRVISDNGRTPLAQLAYQAGLPISTARRTIAAFQRAGMLMPGKRGCYVAGAKLVRLAPAHGMRSAISSAARPIVRKLARDYKVTAHIGCLDDGMVTYLVKEHGGLSLFTRESQQLEAYCSAIGKVLLAALEPAALDSYFTSGSLVSLTERTITDPCLLRQELVRVKRHGHATDDEEIADGLKCIAVPVRDTTGCVIAAMSVSASAERIDGFDRFTLLQRLEVSAIQISDRIYMPG